MSDDIKKQHLSSNERDKWNKCIADLATHTGAGGIVNHPLGNGSVPGFTLNDYTTAEKNKLAGIENNANNYIHAVTHPASMITGLASVATSGSYNSLTDKPTTLTASGGNSDTVGGIRLTIGATGPSGPVVNKELWINTSNNLNYIYKSGGWECTGAVYL
jgi:hypothetical protein